MAARALWPWVCCEAVPGLLTAFSLGRLPDLQQALSLTSRTQQLLLCGHGCMCYGCSGMLPCLLQTLLADSQPDRYWRAAAGATL